MTALGEILAAEIAAHGPMRIDRFMARCLTDPTHGYYTTRDPFGVAGDFVTAPEVSQMFGELIGVWCASAWEVMGTPKRLSLVEIGPGRGTLMADLLRAARVSPPFREALMVHLVEASPVLRERQAAMLKDADVRVHWHDTLDSVPDGPMILIANEFLDALPVRQLVRRGDHFFERLVGLDRGGALTFTLTEAPVSPALVPAFAVKAEDGEIVEFSPDREAFARALGKRLSRWSSSALLIDYGHLSSAPGDTLQAVKNHQYTDVIATAGEADLTAQVDFDAFAAALTAGGASALRPMTQGAFLLAMGLREREEALKQKLDARGRIAIAQAAHRLAASSEMGHLFKVLAATHPDVPPPYPFEALAE